MVIQQQQSMRNHRQHLLEMKMGSPTWRELASTIVHVSLNLAPEHVRIDRPFWNQLIAAVPTFASKVQHLAFVSPDPVLNPNTYRAMVELVPPFVPRFVNLRIVHLKLAHWATQEIDGLLQRLVWSQHPNLRVIILDFSPAWDEGVVEEDSSRLQ